MIVYQKTKSAFLDDVFDRVIEEIIVKDYFAKTGLPFAGSPRAHSTSKPPTATS